MNTFWAITFGLSFPIIGIVLGYFLRWKLLLLVTLVLSAAFLYRVFTVVGMSSEGSAAIIGGSIMMTLAFFTFAWFTRLVCFLARRYKERSRLTPQ